MPQGSLRRLLGDLDARGRTKSETRKKARPQPGISFLPARSQVFCQALATLAATGRPLLQSQPHEALGRLFAGGGVVNARGHRVTGVTGHLEPLMAPKGMGELRSPRPRISVLIVNYNGMEYLPDCLASLYQQTCRWDFEIIVVDNASSDGSVPWLARHHPYIRLVKLEHN